MSYFAITGRVDALRPIPGADRIQVAEVLGTSVIVGMNVAKGDIGLLFPEGGQIAPSFLKRNNLYGHSNLNEDPTKAGYFEDNGRVRAQPFRGVRSEGFFCPLEFLKGTPCPAIPGTQITEWNGETLCWKYIKPAENGGARSAPRAPRFKIQVPEFREHFDTEQWRFYSRKIEDPACRVTITQKYHGTSGRWGYHEASYDAIERWLVENAPFGRLRRLWEAATRVYCRLRRWKPRKRLEYVVGSRRVIIWKPTKVGFHGKEEFRFEILERLKPVLRPGMTIYGEIVGEANNSLIMPAHDLTGLKDKAIARAFGPRMEYRYGCPPNTYDLIVYRVSEGDRDWLPNEIRQFCVDNRLRYPHTFVEETYSRDFEGGAERLGALVRALADNIRTADSPDTLNEGIVIRLDYDDGRSPSFLKEKNFYFKVCEGIAKELDGDPEDES